MNKIILLLAIFTAFQIQAQEPMFQPYNLNFEKGSTGYSPIGWYVPRTFLMKGYSAETSDTEAKSGSQALKFYNSGNLEADKYGSVLQLIDAFPYRGLKIKLTAAVKFTSDTAMGKARLWLHCKFESGDTDVLEYNSKGVILGKDWKDYTLTAEISPYAHNISYGLVIEGAGEAYLDDIRIDVIPEIISKEAPKELSQIELRNLEAFTKAFGYLRYFYPGSEMEKVNWEKYLYDNIEKVELAPEGELHKTFNSIYGPLATASLFSNIKENINFNTYLNQSTFWESFKENKSKAQICRKHIVLPSNNPNTNFLSTWLNIFESVRKREAALLQVVEIPEKYRGKKIRFSADVKVDSRSIAGEAQLWLRMDREKKRIAYMKTMDAAPITEDEWKRYFIEGDIVEDAAKVRVGLILLGEGVAGYDNVTLEVMDKSGKAIDTLEIKNSGFEKAYNSSGPLGWDFPDYSSEAGYFFDIKRDGKRGQFASLMSNEETKIDLPAPGQIYQTFIGSDIKLNFLLTLSEDSTGTLPKADLSANELNLLEKKSLYLNPEDRKARLVIFMYAWNILKHFSIQKIDDFKLDSALTAGLDKSSLASGEKEFTAILKSLFALTNDNQVRVWYGTKEETRELPFLWKWLDGGLYITKTAPGFMQLKAGAQIISIDGIPTQKYMEKSLSYISYSRPKWGILRALAEMRTGFAGESYILEVKNTDGKIKKVTLENELEIGTMVEERPPRFDEISPGVMYIDITRMDDREIKELIPQLEKQDAIIFDARGHSAVSEYMLGLFMNEAIQSLKWKVPIYTMPDHELISYDIITNAIPGRSALSGKEIIFLADERSIGYTEAILELVKENNIGKIVGRPTAGTPGDVSAKHLPGFYNFSMTAVLGQSPTGEMMFGKAVLPDIKVETTIEGIMNGRDEILDKAVEIVKNLGK